MLHVEEIRPLRMPDAPYHRLITIGIVVGIHIVVISAFMLSLHPNFFPKEAPGPIESRVILEPRHETFVKPPTVTLRTADATIPKEPSIVIDETPPRDAIGGVVAPPTGPIAPTIHDFGPRPIVGTHTIPDYPFLDSRQGHEGTVTLRLAINERGVVTDAVVEHSSGYDGLDQAAVNWVKAHWRYYPATHSGDAVASSTDVSVTFRLTNRN